MSSSTVAAGTGRVSITTLPSLASPQPDDRLLAVQGETVGLLRVEDLPHDTAPDLSSYATTTALTEARQSLAEQIAQEAQARQQAIAALPSPPDTSHFVTDVQLTSETTARGQADTALGERIDALAKTSSGGASLPVGTISFYAGPTPPENWLIRDGSSFSISRYPPLAKLYPNGVLPDDRGLFLRGYDPTGIADMDGATRGFGSYQEGSFVVAEWATDMCSLNQVQNTFISQGERIDGIRRLNWDIAADRSISLSACHVNGGTTSASASPDNSSNEVLGVTRPKNRNYLPIIYAGTPAT